MTEPARITYAGELYDRTWGLKDGSIKPDGIDLEYKVLNARDVFPRMLSTKEFDASEMSLGTQSLLVAKEGAACPFFAIPVFTSRVFRHGYIFVNGSSEIRGPRDLEGKRVGVSGDFTATANVWIRGLLENEFGVNLEKITWVSGTQPRVPFPAKFRQRFKLLESKSTQHLAVQLEKQEIDAYTSPDLPPNFYSSPYSEGTIRRLFPNHRELEAEYFRRTKIFPIMHTVVIRREIIERNDSVAESLYEAFERAKTTANQRVVDTRFGLLTYALAWLPDYIADERKVLGADPFAYGLGPNKHVLNTFLDYCLQQDLVERRPEVEELFTSVD